MYLKSESFSFRDEAITLYELSALQRIEHLEYLKAMESLPAEDTSALMNLTVRTSALVVAMSLWHGLETKERAQDAVAAQTTALHQEILNSWPLEAIAAADFRVKVLSGMISESPESPESPEAPASETAGDETSEFDVEKR